MTLYSKWSAGKNIAFIGLVVMTVALFIPWLSTGKIEKELGIVTVDQLVRLFDQLEGLIKLSGSEYVKIVNSFKFVYYVDKFRWLFLIPMIYPAVFLFWSRAKKNLACISGLIAFLVPLVLLFFAVGIFSVGIWFYIIGALVCFLGCTMDVPVKAVVSDAAAVSTAMPQADASVKKFCPFCGAQNLKDAAFCENCGKEIPR